MTKEEAISELSLLRVNVERLLSNLRETPSAFSQRERNHKILIYERRIEALTFAIEATTDVITQ